MEPLNAFRSIWGCFVSVASDVSAKMPPFLWAVLLLAGAFLSLLRTGKPKAAIRKPVRVRRTRRSAVWSACWSLGESNEKPAGITAGAFFNQMFCTFLRRTERHLATLLPRRVQAPCLQFYD